MEESIEQVLRDLRRQLEDLRQSAFRTAQSGEHLVEATHNIGMRLAGIEAEIRKKNAG